MCKIFFHIFVCWVVWGPRFSQLKKKKKRHLHLFLCSCGLGSGCTQSASRCDCGWIRLWNLGFLQTLSKLCCITVNQVGLLQLPPYILPGLRVQKMCRGECFFFSPDGLWAYVLAVCFDGIALSLCRILSQLFHSDWSYRVRENCCQRWNHDKGISV